MRLTITLHLLSGRLYPKRLTIREHKHKDTGQKLQEIAVPPISNLLPLLHFRSKGGFVIFLKALFERYSTPCRTYTPGGAEPLFHLLKGKRLRRHNAKTTESQARARPDHPGHQDFEH